MPKPFDAASKHIIETYPKDWLALGGLPTDGAMEIVDTDLSIVSTSADKIVRVTGPDPYAAHVEFQASKDFTVDGRVLLYNVLTEHRLQIQVLSVVFLLRPEALPGVTGRVFRAFGRAHKLDFVYQVVRVWELDPQLLLSGGLGTLPLAPISAVREADLPRIINVMKERLSAELPVQEAREVWVAARVLMGLRYSDEMVRQLIQGVYGMEESSTYQAILEQGRRSGFELGVERGIERGVKRGVKRGTEKGRIIEARDALLRRGQMRFGAPDPAIIAAVEAITDLPRLQALFDRLLDGHANDWPELLA